MTEHSGAIEHPTDDNPGGPAEARRAATRSVTPRNAASLILWRQAAAGPEVLMGLRHASHRFMPNVLVFPGGRVDPEDVDAIAAALREAHEEIALAPHSVTVAGVADRYRTGTGYHITPVIGVVPPDLSLRPSEAEVASVFEVPLAFLLDPANHREGVGIWQEQERRYIEIRWEDRRIWGATAAMIVNLSRRLAHGT